MGAIELVPWDGIDISGQDLDHQLAEYSGIQISAVLLRESN